MAIGLTVFFCCAYESRAVTTEDGTYVEDGILKTAVKMSVPESELPDMPYIVLTTENGVHPYSKQAVHPADVPTIGETVVGNEYVNGTFRMKDGIHVIQGDMKVKVRGNTSAYDGEKDPYRLKLDKKADLIGFTKERADKDWILLDTGDTLTYFMGAGVSSLCGMEWTPAFKYVNLILNGDYRGIYVLTEAVEKDSDKVNISDEGFMLEYTPYWWKNDDPFFRTAYGIPEMAYTFEYPDADIIDDTYCTDVRSYMNNFETWLHNGNIFGYFSVDQESFINWLLAKDLLGMGDSAGSNIYLSIDKMDMRYPLLYRLKIGPLWDYDTIFTYQGFSQIHTDSSFYYPLLFRYGSFRRAYSDKWKEVRETCKHDLCHYIYRMKYSELAKALDESRLLEHERWGHHYESVADELDDYVIHISDQIRLLDALILPTDSTGVN